MNPFAEDHESAAHDETLVARANTGDRPALEELIGRHQAWVYNIALRMLWEPADAEDATQEVLLKVITRLSTFQGRSRFRTWLYRIACNHVLGMKRGRAEDPDPRAFMAEGYVDPSNLRFAGAHTRQVSDAAPDYDARIDRLTEDVARAIHRQQPFPDQAAMLRTLLARAADPNP